MIRKTKEVYNYQSQIIFRQVHFLEPLVSHRLLFPVQIKKCWSLSCTEATRITIFSWNNWSTHIFRPFHRISHICGRVTHSCRKTISIWTDIWIQYNFPNLKLTETRASILRGATQATGRDYCQTIRRDGQTSYSSANIVENHTQSSTISRTTFTCIEAWHLTVAAIVIRGSHRWPTGTATRRKFARKDNYFEHQYNLTYIWQEKHAMTYVFSSIPTY